MKMIKHIVFMLSILSSLAASARSPDIVIFISDDQSRDDCQAYAERGIPTPNMRRLAEEGMTFERAYVVSPSCAPSRATLLTGLSPARNGAEANHSRPKAELKKWPAYFQELGYEVVAFGKVSHYKHTADYGFDYFAHDTFHDHQGIPKRSSSSRSAMLARLNLSACSLAAIGRMCLGLSPRITLNSRTCNCQQAVLIRPQRDSGAPSSPLRS